MSARHAPPPVGSLEELTPGWLTEALRAAGSEDVTVEEVRSSPVGTGQMATCHRLELRYASGRDPSGRSSGGGPTTLVVKLPSTDPGTREVGASSVYRTEVGFYREFSGRVSIKVPRCSYADISADGTEFVILMEDSAPATPGDQIAGCTVEEARAAALNVAGLHGPTWCDPGLRDLDWVMASGAASQEIVVPFLAQATPIFVDRYDLADEDVRVLRRFTEAVGDWLVGRPEFFSLVHNDYRLDNLLFDRRQRPPEVTTVDWQVLTVGLPPRDLAFLLGTGLPTDERRRAEETLAAEYHQALLGHGVTGYPFERCWDDYRYGLFGALVITVLGAAVAKREERGDRMFTVMAERACAAIRDLDALDLL